MSYIITQKCAGTCDSSCVDVCPVDCIEGLVPLDQLRAMVSSERGQMFIDPDRCTDCGACVQACPIDAIRYEDEALAADVARNRSFFARQ
jgi:ferredoxin